MMEGGQLTRDRDRRGGWEEGAGGGGELGEITILRGQNRDPCITMIKMQIRIEPSAVVRGASRELCAPKRSEA